MHEPLLSNLPPPPTELQEFTQWAQSLVELSRREGEVSGEARRGAEDVLLVLKARGVVLPPAAEQRITSCTDPATLSTWLQRAATATTADEVFGT